MKHLANSIFWVPFHLGFRASRNAQLGNTLYRLECIAGSDLMYFWSQGKKYCKVRASLYYLGHVVSALCIIVSGLLHPFSGGQCCPGCTSIRAQCKLSCDSQGQEGLPNRTVLRELIQQMFNALKYIWIYQELTVQSHQAQSSEGDSVLQQQRSRVRRNARSRLSHWASSQNALT